MGIVWEAQSSLGRRVVVKSPLINHDHDAIKIERLLIEASVLRRLNDEHPSAEIDELVRAHVVRYVDQLPNESFPFLVTEYLSGQPVNQVYDRKPLGERYAIQQVLALLRTLKLIHSRGVIHRDISPSNILTEGERGMVLIDFGTSIVLNGEMSLRSSQSGRIVFKRGYSAPELLQGNSDARCDVFSVGATMFYLLTGRSPADFMRSSADGLMKMPRDLNSKISIEAFEVIRRAVSPDPANRFQTADEMIRAVEANPTFKEATLSALTIGGVVYELRPGFVDVGRNHVCDAECKTLGFNKPLQVRIVDPQKYIEKHHARIWISPTGECSIEDLRTANRTAIKHGKSTFKVIPPSTREPLSDQDVVGLAYTQNRGPYMTFMFTQGRGY